MGWDPVGIGAARLVEVGSIKPNPRWFMPKHRHTYWEFVYFRQGCGEIELPGKTLRAREYHLVIYPPGLTHAEIADSRDPEGTIYLGAEISGSLAHTPLFLPDRSGELLWLSERILEEYVEHGMSPIVEAYLHAFLHIVDRLQRSAAAVPLEPIDIVLAQIHRNHDQQLDLDDLTAIACMSKTHLINCFRSRVGQSPMRYLQSVRVEAAKRLLATSHMPIAEVALSVGFQDPLYFSRVFKRIAGCSPTAFRQRSSLDIGQ